MSYGYLRSIFSLLSPLSLSFKDAYIVYIDIASVGDIFGNRIDFIILN